MSSRIATTLLALMITASPTLMASSSPPVGIAIDIHNHSNATPERELLVRLSATDDVGVTGYYLSESSAAPIPVDFEPIASISSFEAEVPYTLTGDYGTVIVFAFFLDEDGNISQPLAYELQYLDKESVVVWTVLAGSTVSDAGLEVATDPLGNTYVTGYRFGQTFGGGDRAYVGKFDLAGINQWEQTVSSSGGVGTGLTQGIDIAVDAIGTSYTAGYDLVDVQGDDLFYDAFLVKFDSAGTLDWFESLSSAGPKTYGMGVALSPAGGIYMVGRTNGALAGETHHGDWDAFIARYESNGSLAWIEQFGTAAGDNAYDLAIDENGNLYVVGYTDGPLFGEQNIGPDGADIFLSKFDSNGNHLWTRLMGKPDASAIAQNVKLANGFVYLAGGFYECYGCGTMDVFLAKYTTTGGEKWHRVFDGHVFNSHEEAFGLAVDSLGAAYLVGQAWDPIDGNQPLGYNDIFVMKYGPTGERLFTFTYGTADSDRGYGATIAPDGDLLVTGLVGADLHGQPAYGSDDIVLLRLDLGTVAIPAAISADGFESGDLSSWSSSLP